MVVLARAVQQAVKAGQPRFGCGRELDRVVVWVKICRAWEICTLGRDKGSWVADTTA